MKLFKGLFGKKEEETKEKVTPQASQKEKVSKMTEDYVNPKEAYRIEKEKRQKENAIKRAEEEKNQAEENLKLAEIEKQKQAEEAKIREEKLQILREEQEAKKAATQKVSEKKEEEAITFAGITIDTFSKGDVIKVEVMEETRDAYLVRGVENFQDAKLLKSEMDDATANIGDILDVIVWKHYADEDYVSLRRYKNRVEAKAMMENFDTEQVVSAKVVRFKAPMFDVVMDNGVKAKVFVKNMDTKFIDEDNAGEYIDNTYEFIIVKKFEDALPNQALFELNRRSLLNKIQEERIKELTVDTIIEVSEFTTNKGGVNFEYNSIRGFVPLSEMAHTFSRSSEEALANISLPARVTITEIKKQRGQYQIVGSIKRNLMSPFDEFLNDHQVGDIVEAEIARKERYGLILNVTPNFRALLHESEFSTETATLIKSLNVGEKLTVKIKEIDFDKNQVKLTSNLNDEGQADE